jgi:hypothetical protein
MTNRLQTIIPAMFQPVDPVIATEPTSGNRSERLTAAAAISLALLLVGLIAVLMGTT